MSILDKHPAPWRISDRREKIVHGTIDSVGELAERRGDQTVMRAVGDTRLEFASLEIERLILAAPELLAALKGVILEADRNTDRFMAAKALIERIEKGAP